MAKQINVRNAANTAWENLLKDVNIEITDAGNRFTSSFLDGALDEIKTKLDTSTSANTNYALVQRDFSGGFSAGGVTVTSLTVINSLNSNLIPDTNGTRDLGSDTYKFNRIYAKELYLSPNSLYLGDTKILGTNATTVEIKTDVDQSILLKTSGVGVTQIASASMIDINTAAANAPIKLQATGVGSTVTLNATGGIVVQGNTAITGTLSATGAASLADLTISGNLTVNGSIADLSSTSLTVDDNIIDINKGEPSNTGVTAGQAGLRIYRGIDPIPYLMVFDEPSDTMLIGFAGSLQTVATQTWVANTANAATATKLQTARTISLTGSVTGSGSFDGSGNLSIATTTNHTHSTLSQGNGIATFSYTGGSAATISVDYATVVGTALGTAATGTSNKVAREDHVHPTTGLMTTGHAANSITGLGSSGTATTVSRSDHAHAILSQGNGIATFSYTGSGTAQVAVDYATIAGTALGVAVTGTSTKVAREDHVHPTTGLMLTSHAANSITGFGASAAALGTSAAGTATTVSRSDHVHALPALASLTDVTITTPANTQILGYNGTKWANQAQSFIDHGSISGLGDDDHSQYLNNTRHDTTSRHGSSVVDHGSIGGLSDDDHPQYVLATGTRAFTGTITGVTPTATNHLATKGYVDSLIQGLDWQESVKDKDLATPPGSPVTGDRYIVGTGATGLWTGQTNKVTYWDGAAWQFLTVDEGTACWVEDEDFTYVWNGTAWVIIGGLTNHNATTGMQGGTTNEYYHLTAAEYNDLTDGGDCTEHYHASDRALGNATGTLAVTKGGTGVTAIATDQILYGSSANTFSTATLTSFGRSLIDDTDAATARSTLGLAGAAILSVGTAAGTVAAGDHTHTNTSAIGGPYMLQTHAANSITGFGASVTALGTSSAGSATTVSRSDHTHPTTGLMTTGHAANSITGFGGNGSATTVSRSDHTHSYLASTGGTVSGKVTVQSVIGTASNYTTGQLELNGGNATDDVTLGFHRPGATACALQHKGDGLELRDQAGTLTSFKAGTIYSNGTTVALSTHTHANDANIGGPYALSGHNHGETTTATANTIVKRDASGYIYGVYINSSRADENTAAASYLYDTGDGWIRKKTLANARAEILSGHTHTNDSSIGGPYAASSHGNHVPTVQSANNAVFLRNDNSWQTVTPANIGAATSSHNHTLDSLSNVTITANASGEILKWNGTAWINNTLAEAGIAAASHTHSYLATTGGTISGNLTVTGDLTVSGTISMTNIPTADMGGNIWVATAAGTEGITSNVVFGVSTAPASPQTNQIWFDSTNRVVKMWDGASWITFGAAYN